MKKTITLLFIVLFTTFSFGQNNYQDVVYLKNGSIIRGMITEQIPNESLKIETADRSLFVYQMDEIQKITKEPIKNKQHNIVNAEDYWSLSIGASIPTGDFADDDDAGAGVGLNIGLKYLYPLNQNGLGLYFSTDFNFNGLKQDLRDDLEDNSDIDVKFSKFINIPITTGLNYSYNANENVSLFSSVGVGLNFLKITDMELEFDSSNKATTSFDLSTQLAYKIGVGAVFNNKYIIGIHYNGLGNHSIKGETEYNDTKEDFDDYELDLESFSVSLGIKL